MHTNAKICLAAALLSLAAWSLWPTSEPSAANKFNSPSAEQSQHTVHTSGTLIGGSPQLNSPFGRGSATPPALGETEASIRKVFKAAGFRTPDRYYSMGFRELKTLASNGDIYANIQLGTKYLYARAAMENDPDYDFSVNPRAEAYAAFRQVAMMGNSPAMAMLSTVLADVDPIEAYAWRELAGASSDVNRDFYREGRRNLDLTNDQLAKARARTQLIERDLMASPPPRFPPE